MSVIFEWKESEMLALLDSCRRDEAGPIIERHFKAGQRLVEAGCGSGRWLRFFSDKGFKVTGLEYKAETVAMVKKIWPDLDIVEGDCEASPFSDNSFDGGLSFGVVEHWSEGPQKPLQDLRRILKPGAKAFISVPCLNGVRRLKRFLWFNELIQAPKALAARLLKGKSKPLARVNKGYLFPVFPAWGPFFEYRMSTAQFKSELETAGFEVVEILPLGLMDGIYHDLNPLELLIKWRDWKFIPGILARWMLRFFSRRPFAICHMQAAIVRKPMGA